MSKVKAQRSRLARDEMHFCGRADVLTVWRRGTLVCRRKYSTEAAD